MQITRGTAVVFALAALSSSGLVGVAYLAGLFGSAGKPPPTVAQQHQTVGRADELTLPVDPQAQPVGPAGELPLPAAHTAGIKDELPPPADQQAHAVDTTGKDRLAETIAPNWPTVLTPVVQADPSEQPPPQWSARDIEEGRARCAVLLKGLDVIAHPADPIREGEACGTPAPMQLVSIGSSPRITFSPPATLNCEMIVALHAWLQRDVQPLARQHLGTPITGVKTMSSFSCRNAYGRAKTRLSEHGRVNAIDIGSFVTTEGEAQVIAHWGPIAGEGATAVAGAQAEVVKRQAEAAAATRKGKGQAKPDDMPRLATTGLGTDRSYQAGTTIPMPTITFGFRNGGDDSSDVPRGLGWAPPSRLGGPKVADATALQDRKTEFLHAIHKAACTIFSTVLGPDADKAHRNHFHLDLAVRKSVTICQ